MTTAATKNKRRRPLRFRSVPGSNIPKVVPPRTVVILTSIDATLTPDWKNDRGRIFRVGYYNRNDGLDCIWLVNDAGEYEQTTDRATLLKHFVILKLSNENDLYGDHRPPLRPRKTTAVPAFSIPQLLVE
ncbi:MAG TPA: hypothetical protein VGR35_03700 [Tepidisphaeraceae bacterium]|nr:hypothetical protein [Tepidisphaeraceae bacterium]